MLYTFLHMHALALRVPRFAVLRLRASRLPSTGAVVKLTSEVVWG